MDPVYRGRKRERKDVIEGEIHTYKVESSHLYVGEVGSVEGIYLSKI